LIWWNSGMRQRPPAFYIIGQVAMQIYDHILLQLVSICFLHVLPAKIRAYL
jgi:hypothetical protein